MSLDQIDRANALAQVERDTAVERISAAVAAPGREDCEDCSDPIEAARRKACPSATRCVGCQAAAERRARLHAGRVA
jgi:phage/conjugal plasmid C-4 type zinc finger TraR family protein